MSVCGSSFCGVCCTLAQFTLIGTFQLSEHIESGVETITERNHTDDFLSFLFFFFLDFLFSFSQLQNVQTGWPSVVVFTVLHDAM